MFYRTAAKFKPLCSTIRAMGDSGTRIRKMPLLILINSSGHEFNKKTNYCRY